jgi:hypothetical protein
MADPGIGKYGELFGSIIIDIVGLASYLIPGIGEASDIATAPINAAWVLDMLNDVEGSEDDLVAEAFATFAGAEELAPFIDIIPSATLAWIYKWFFLK